METNARIRNALTALMASSLYDSITIDDIVKEAGISKKTLYRHYESKDAIFDDVFHELFTRPTHKIRESLDVDRIYSMPTLMLEQAYSVLYENRVPMESYYKSRGMAGWIDLHCRNLLDSNAEIYRQWGLDESEVGFVAYFVTVAGAAIRARWIDGGYREAPAELARLTRKWLLSQFDVQRDAR